MTFTQLWKTAPSKRYAYFCWFIVAYCILVILWGALVRATGSGAGCGDHWPLCNGEVLPSMEAAATQVEFFHRITSSLAGVLVIAGLVGAWRVFPAGHRVRSAAVASLVLILVEGALGALLVRNEWVADDVSIARTIAAALHLANTLFLLGSMTLQAWWASGGLPLDLRANKSNLALLSVGILGLIIFCAFGAIVALGDTLFPPETLAEGLAQKFDHDAHFAVRMRLWHPLLAIATTTYLAFILYQFPNLRHNSLMGQFGVVTVGLLVTQLLVGVANVVLLAPLWMQVLHLLLADICWVTMLLWSFTAVAVPHPAGELALHKPLYLSNGHTPQIAHSSYKQKVRK